jgi:hypothetical protein
MASSNEFARSWAIGFGFAYKKPDGVIGPMRSFEAGGAARARDEGVLSLISNSCFVE